MFPRGYGVDIQRQPFRIVHITRERPVADMNGRRSRDLHEKARYAMRPTMIRKDCNESSGQPDYNHGGAVSGFGIRQVDHSMR